MAVELELQSVEHQTVTQEEQQTRGVLMQMLAEGRQFAFLTIWFEGNTDELHVKLESSLGEEDNDLLAAILDQAKRSLSA